MKKLISKVSRSLVKFLLYFNKFIFLINTNSNKNLSNFFKKIEPIETGRPLIRLGNDFDVAYLIPNDLSNQTNCFTLGAGNDISFEHDLSKRAIHSYLADGSAG